MSGQWAFHLPADRCMAAAAIRLWRGIRVLQTDDAFWLSGDQLSDALELELRKLPGGTRYELQDDGSLTPAGKRVPTGMLPKGNWQAIAEFFVLHPQPSALAAEAGSPADLLLVRSSDELPASILMTSFSTWADWAQRAPLLRLSPLTFAASFEGHTIVRGSPLPAIAGRRFTEISGVAIPCGFEFSPAVDSASLRKLVMCDADDLILFQEDGSWEVIAENEFVPATRANVRATGANVL